MCGRYLVDDEVYADMWEMLLEKATAAGPPLSSLIKSGEVFPTNIAPVITHDGAAVVKWGFPHWKGTGVIINARAETVFDKNMFRKPLLNSRCVIPSSGFFEWRRKNGVKTKDKYLLRQPGERVLYMAGIVNTFRDANGNDYSAFVILTTAANDSVAPIHDRMPVIIASDESGRWIRDEGFIEHALHRAGPELTAQPY